MNNTTVTEAIPKKDKNLYEAIFRTTERLEEIDDRLDVISSAILGDINTLRDMQARLTVEDNVQGGPASSPSVITLVSRQGDIIESLLTKVSRLEQELN